LATALATPRDIAADPSYVYWSDYDGGDIRRVLAGGGQQKVVVKDLGHPVGIALDGTHVYYAAETSGEIARVVHDGSSAAEPIATGQVKPAYVAVDDGFVYWTSYGITDSDGLVSKAPITGGAITILAAAQNQPYQIAVDDTHVYWTTLGGKTVMRAPK
jgi:sugar lactone lactonase YvrE